MLERRTIVFYTVTVVAAYLVGQHYKNELDAFWSNDKQVHQLLFGMLLFILCKPRD